MAQTTYDPDSDQQHALDHIREQEVDGTQTGYDREFGGIANNYGNEAEHPLGEGEAGKTADAGELKKDEKKAPDRSGFSAGDDINEKLGKGYSGKGSTKSKGLSRLFNSNSGLKKKVAIAGGAAGGSAIISVLVFLALLPLKIEHIVTNLESKYAAAGSQAVDTETQNLFSQYVTKQIMPNLNKGACHSTIDPTCVSVADGTTPVGKLFAAWKQGKLEQKLATKYGIIIGAKGDNTFYLNVKGYSYDIHSGQDIFNLPDTNTATRNEVRQAVRDGLKNATLYDRIYFRYKIGKLMETKYGVKRCVIACKTRDNYADSLANKKLAARAYLFRNLLPQKYGLIMQCVIGGCETKLATAQPGDTERLSPFQKNLQKQLAAYAAKFGSDKLEDLVKNADNVGKDGLKKVVAREAVKSLVSSIGGDTAGALAGEAAEKAVTPVGWVIFGSTVVVTASSIGPILAQASYAANKASAVELYQSYNTVSSEMKSGHIDSTELGSFSDVLSTNLSGLSTDNVDATQTPLYNSLMGSGSTTTSTSFLNNLFPTSYADTPAASYTCDNGKPVRSGKLVCDEEVLNIGNSSASNISDFVNGIPGLVPVAGAVHAVGTTISKIIVKGIELIPGVSTVTSWIGSQASSLLGLVMNKLIVTPFSDSMSGGRVFDMMAAGADASADCQLTLGCEQASDVAVNDIRNQQAADEKVAFEGKPMLARMFDTSSSYSFVSRLAMGMPSNLLTATNAGTASMLSNPINRISGVLSNMFTTNRAFAATTAQPDPFGIPQKYFPASDIPTDPEAYWKANCTGDYMTPWLNSQTQDPSTGEAIATKTNPCMLISTSVQIAGGLYDSSLLPKDLSGAAATASSVTGSAGTTIPTGTTVDLAHKVGSNPNITFQTKQDSDYFDSVLVDGTQSQCGGPTISPTLLGVILQLSQKYKIVLGVFDDGHGCDNGFHPKGMAVDINGVNAIDGSSGTGNRIDWTAGDIPIMQQFYNDASAILSANGGGGLGELQCFGGANIIKASGVSYFDDTCNHLHLDVGKR
jgi:hypothetical protein